MSTLVLQMPPQVPRRGNALTRGIGRFVLRVSRWRITGEMPDLRRMLWIVAPHTSNWDWVLAMVGVMALGVRANYLAKHTIFFWPLGPLLRWSGGVPVNRTAPAGMVEDVAARIRASSEVIVAITPEGTRSRVTQWKTGFLRIAELGGLPIVQVSWDYSRREIRFGPIVAPSGDHAMDIERIRAYYRQFTGRNPENQSS